MWVNLYDNYIKLIMTFASERLIGTHSQPWEEKPRDSVDLAQSSEFVILLSLI